MLLNDQPSEQHRARRAPFERTWRKVTPWRSFGAPLLPAASRRSGGSGAGAERRHAAPSAHLVGNFHHVCADAVRAHRRRQRWCGLAADVGVEPAELVDERAATGLGGIERLVEQVVRPAFADLPVADVDLWITAKIVGLGWQAAGEAAGMDRAAIARVRRRISRFLSSEGVLRRLRERLDDVP